jgi:hypothetical protein
MFSATASALFAAFALQAGSAQAPDSGIAVQELGAIHPLEVDAGGSLPETVWSSGDAVALGALLETLPTAQAGWRSPAAGRLALGALLSGGPAPDGAQDRFALAELRARRALAVGRPQPVLRLLERTPQINQSPGLSRVYAELAFALGQTEEACRAANALLDERDAPYWLRARAACLAIGGNIPAGELTAELARAQAPNREFDAIFDAFTLDRTVDAGFAPATGLQLALAALAAPERRFEAAETAPAWLHRAAARTGPRIALPETLPEALEAAVAMEGEARSVALGAIIQQDLDRVIAAEALAIRLTDAAQDGAFVEIASAYGAEVARLPITADTLAHGRLFVLAALAADDVVAAEAWREALFDGPRRAEPEPPPQPVPADGPSALSAPPGYASGATETLGPEWTPPPPGVMVALDFARAVAAGRIEDDGFAALLAARIEGATPERLCQAALLTALGADDGGALRAAMTGLARSADAPAPVLAPGLLAAGAGAIGESALHAALVLEAAPQDAEACAGAGIILQLAGLEGEALRLALELILEDAA